MSFGFSSLSALFKGGSSDSSPKEGVIGIDLGSSALKVVQIKDVKGVPTLETYGELQLGPYEGVDIGRNTYLPPGRATLALVDILREASVTGKDAMVAFSYGSSFTSTISVPTTDESQIATMLPVEVRKYIPTSLTKVTLDWVPLAVRESTRSTDVLISAIYNEERSRYEAILQGAGLVTRASEIELFSAVRAVVTPKDTVLAVIDFGAFSTRLYIVEKGVVKKTHSVLLSGVELTRALESVLQIDFPHAEEQKRLYGLEGIPSDPRIQKTLLPVVERGLREFHTVVRRYEDAEKIHIEKVILTGGGAHMKGLVTYAHDMFSLPVEVARPFSKVAYPTFLEDTLVEAGPIFSVALGVALRAHQQKS